MDKTTAATTKDNLHKKIDKMDDHQLRLLESFIKELFDLDD